ncbi:MAG: metalloregulator ArsR/SmtB family transcription factor [Patescibacteria group bacterium]
MKLIQIQLEAKLFKGFADQSRLLILATISDGPKTVTEIVDKTKLSQPNTSAHLACLLECGLIKKERKGREIFYEASSKDVSEIISYARKILKKHSKEIYNCAHY